jgi:nucleotide-binding universal stress UspA family protein
MFTDILLAITPSEICQHAADTAFAFAQKHNAKLCILNICGLPTDGWGSIEHLIPSGEVNKIKSNIEAYYQEPIKALGKNVCVEVMPGLPHSEILRIARKLDADLIVMGPHNREIEEKRSKMWGMAGSTLEKVSQKARCPVMIVSRACPVASHGFSSLLVATDFSEQAECAVGYSGQLARQYKAKLTLLNVVDSEDLKREIVEKKITESKARMEEAFSSRLAGLDYSFEAWEGEPAMEILKIARLKNADLIIMAHHSRETDPEKAFLGSTVSQVALNASCPTISVNRHFDLRCGLVFDQHGGVVQTAAHG